MSSTPKRRALRFNNLDEMLKDAESLVNAEEIESTGEWNLAQSLMHLALTTRISMDGAGNFKRPFVMRLLGPFIKRRVLKKGVKPGYKLPERQARLLNPKPTTKLSSAWDALQRQTERLKECGKFQPHPMFGPMTRDEWLQLALRQAELQLSYHAAAE